MMSQVQSLQELLRLPVLHMTPGVGASASRGLTAASGKQLFRSRVDLQTPGVLQSII